MQTGSDCTVDLKTSDMVQNDHILFRSKCLKENFGKKIRVMKENSNSQKTELTIDVDMGTAPVIKAQNDDMGIIFCKFEC
jgi:hypothetical protein